MRLFSSHSQTLLALENILVVDVVGFDDNFCIICTLGDRNDKAFLLVIDEH